MAKVRLTDPEYQLLLPIKPIWEKFKKTQTITDLNFTQSQILSVIFERLCGYKPGNCGGSCLSDLFLVVMRNFDVYEEEKAKADELQNVGIPVVVGETFEEIRKIINEEIIKPKRKRIKY